jgi:hypothetical protein
MRNATPSPSDHHRLGDGTTTPLEEQAVCIRLVGFPNEGIMQVATPLFFVFQRRVRLGLDTVLFYSFQSKAMRRDRVGTS